MTTDDDKPFELTDSDGTPEPGESFESDVAALTRAIRKYLDAELRSAPLVELFAALENVEAWYEDDDPRSMGWVDDKGRP
jgi:hypothetical protein